MDARMADGGLILRIYVKPGPRIVAHARSQGPMASFKLARISWSGTCPQESTWTTLTGRPWRPRWSCRKWCLDRSRMLPPLPAMLPLSTHAADLASGLKQRTSAAWVSRHFHRRYRHHSGSHFVSERAWKSECAWLATRRSRLHLHLGACLYRFSSRCFEFRPRRRSADPSLRHPTMRSMMATPCSRRRRLG